jgi:TP901 family phage tail tape measure protein
MVGFTIPLAYLGTVASKTFMQMEEQAIRFKRVYGDTFTATAETDKMIDQVKRLAGEFTKYGVQVEKTMKMAADAAAMGKMGADLLAQIKEASTLAVLGGVEQEQALETTISLTNAFGIAAEKLAGKINFLNAVENQTVTSIEDLTIAIPKAAPVIKQLGGDVEDLTFFLTAMKEGGINASEGANALKSGLASLINPTDKASKFLEGFGINLKGIVEANKGNVKGLVTDFAKALDTLDPLNRARSIEQLFGKFQFSRLSTLFQNVIAEGSQAERVLKLTRNSTEELAILSERELKRVEDSPMYKFKKAVEDLKVSLVPLGEAFLKAVTPLVEFAKGFLDRFNSMGEGAKQFAVIATTVVAGIGPVLLMTFGLIANGVANLIKMFAAISNIFRGAGKSSTDLGTQTEYMTQQQLEAAAVAASLDQTHAKLIQTFGVETAAVEKLATAYARAVVAQSKLVGAPAGGKRGAASQKPMKLQSGILSVPGPKGAGDVVPAMLSPGEAVIPAKQSQKYAGLIQGMMKDEIPGFRFGRNPFASMLGRSRVAVRMKQEDLQAALGAGKKARYQNAFATGTGADYLTTSGLQNPAQAKLRSAMERDVFGIPLDAAAGSRPTYGYARTSPLQAIINKLFGFKGRQFNTVTANQRIGEKKFWSPANQPDVKYPELDRNDPLARYGDVDLITRRSVAKRSSAHVGDALIRYNRVLGGRKSVVPVDPRFGAAPIKGATQSQLDKAMFDTLNSPFGNNRVPGTNMYNANPKPGYVETYTPGGFGLNEVSRIVTRDRGTAKQLQKLVDRAGLRIKVTPQNAPLVVRMLSNVIGSRFSEGSDKISANIIRELRSKLRGSPTAISDAYKGVTYGALAQEDALVKSLATKYGLSQSQVLSLLGTDNSHIGKVTRTVTIGGSAEEAKLWRMQDIQKDHRAVNQILENISVMGSPKGSFLQSLTAEEISRSQKIGLEDARRELANIKAGGHPTSRAGYQVLKGIADITANKFPTKATGVRAKILSELLDFRFKDKTAGSYFKALEAKKLTLPADDKITSRGIAQQDRRIATANQQLALLPSVKRPAKNPTTKVQAPKLTRGSKQQAAISMAQLLGKRYASGVVSVPGPKGAGDVVPAMLSPGEAVIPAKMSEKYAPLISSMISDSVPGYAQGRQRRNRANFGSNYGPIARGEMTPPVSQTQVSASVANTLMASMKSSRVKTAFGNIATSVGNSISSGLSSIKGKLVDAASSVQERISSRQQAQTGQIVQTGNRYYEVDENGKKRQIKKADALARQQSQPKPSLGSRISGRLGTVGMVGSTVGMGMMMSGDPGMQQAGGLVMGASMLAPLLPMIMNPIGLTVTALAALAAGAYFLNEQFKQNVKNAYDLEMATGGSAQALQKFSEFSGNVGAGEIMDRRRDAGVDVFQTAAGKTGFGEAYLQSEAGKSMYESFSKVFNQQGRDSAISNLTSQMTTAVASGVLDAGQARDIVAALGKQLNDYSFSISVNSKLLSLLGPNGENLLTNPLQIRIAAIESSREQVAATLPDVSYSQDFNKNYGLAEAMIWIGNTFLGQDSLTNSDIDAGKVSLSNDPAAIGSYVASTAIALQTNQEMLDSLQLQHEQLVANAKARGDLAEVARLEKQYEEDRTALLRENATTVKAIQDNFARFTGPTQAKVLTQYKDLTKELYKDDPIQTKMLEGLETNLAALDDDKEVVIRAALLSKDLSPTAANNLLSGENVDTNVDLMVKLGAQGYNKADSIAGMFDKKGNTAQLFKDKLLGFEDPVDAENYMSSFDSVIQSLSAAGDSALTVGMEFYFKNPELLTDANKDIAEFKKKTEGKPITMDIIQQVYGQEMVDQIKTNQAYFDSLPDDQKVTYTTVLRMVGEMDPAAKMIAAINFVKSGKGADQFKKMTGMDYATASASGTMSYEWVNSKAVEVFDTYYAESVTSAGDTSGGTTKAPTTKAPGGKKDDPYEDILRDLKRLRNWTIKTAGGFKELQRVMGKSNNMKILGGVESKLLESTAGISAPMASYFAGLDEATQKLFFKIGKDGKLVLTKQGKYFKQAFDERAVGNVYVGLQGQLKTLKQQNIATKKLADMGLDWATASEMAGDAEFAAAVASGKNAAELQKIVNLKKEELELTKKSNALQEARIAIDENNEQNKLNDLIATYSFDDQKAIMASSQLQELIKTGQANTEEFQRLLAQEIKKIIEQDFKAASDALKQAIKDYVAQARAERTVEKQFGKSSPVINSVIQNDQQLMDMIVAAQTAGKELGQEFYARLKQLLSDSDVLGQVFDEGLNNAFAAFDAQEKKIELKFEADTSYLTDPENGIIPKAQRQIADLEYAIDDYNYGLEQISQKETEINEKYEERFKALDEIRKVNDRLVAQEQAQLSVADALTRGDVAAAARAVQDYRAKQVATNAEAQRDALELAKQKELDAITATINGKSLTRKQIEKEIQTIKNQILEIEEKTLEPAEKALRNFTEQRDIAISNVTVLGKTRLEWEGIQNQVALATVNNNAFLSSLVATLSVVEALKKAYGELGGSTPGSVDVATAPTGTIPVFTTPETTKADDSSITINPNLTAAPTPAPTTAPTIDPKLLATAPKDTTAKPITTVKPTTTTKKPTTTTTPKINPAYISAKQSVDSLSSQLQAAREKVASYQASLASAERSRAAVPPSYRYTYDDDIAKYKSLISTWSTTVNWTGTALQQAQTKLKGIPQYLAYGGMVRAMNTGGFISRGTDTVPAMLTPGEFVVRKYAVDNFGVDNLKSINNGTYQGESVYNYEVNISVKSDADADQIARAVMSQIKQIDSQRIRGNSFNG